MLPSLCCAMSQPDSCHLCLELRVPRPPSVQVRSRGPDLPLLLAHFRFHSSQFSNMLQGATGLCAPRGVERWAAPALEGVAVLQTCMKTPVTPLTGMSEMGGLPGGSVRAARLCRDFTLFKGRRGGKYMCSIKAGRPGGGKSAQGMAAREWGGQSGTAKSRSERKPRTQWDLSEAGQGTMSPATCGMEWGEGSYRRRPAGR